MRRREKIAGAIAFTGLLAAAIAAPMSGCAQSAKDCASLGKPDGCGGEATTSTGSTTTTSKSSGSTTDSTTGTGGSGGSGGTGTGGSTTTNTGGGGAAPMVETLPTCGTKVWGDGADQAVRAIASDANGTFIAGEFQGTLDLGDGPMTAGASGSTFVARLDDSLTVVWSKSFDVPFKAMAVSAQGDVVVAGDLTAQADFGCGAPLVPGNGDLYVARYLADGTCVYARGYTATVPRAHLAIDVADNLLLAGSVTGTTAFGKTLTPHGGEDILVAKFDGAGNPVNARSFGGAGDDAATGVAVDLGGKVYVTGTYQGTVDFAAGGGALNSNGHVGVFAAGFNASLASSWSVGLSSPSDAGAAGIVVSPSGELVIGGTFTTSITLGGATVSSAGNAFFLGRLDTAGMGKAMSRVDGISTGDVSAMAVSATGEIAIAGARPTGLYLARFDAGGTVTYQGLATGTGVNHRANAAAWSAAGKLLLGGFFDGSLATTGSQTVTSAGGNDVLVMQVCFTP